MQSLGFPPPETKAESLEILGGIDPLGVEISAQQLEQIQELEANDHHATFIVLSDVHLDDPQVMKHLDLLFQGLESVMPSLFILMGDFMSMSMGGGGTGSYTLQDLKEYLDELGNLILKYPKLAEFSKFVLVPGPNDPGSSSAFPRHPVRRSLRQYSGSQRGSTPCRSAPEPVHTRPCGPRAERHMQHKSVSVGLAFFVIEVAVMGFMLMLSTHATVSGITRRTSWYFEKTCTRKCIDTPYFQSFRTMEATPETQDSTSTWMSPSTYVVQSAFMKAVLDKGTCSAVGEDGD